MTPNISDHFLSGSLDFQDWLSGSDRALRPTRMVNDFAPDAG